MNRSDRSNKNTLIVHEFYAEYCVESLLDFPQDFQKFHTFLERSIRKELVKRVSHFTIIH
jgi:hypothetical protein